MGSLTAPMDFLRPTTIGADGLHNMDKAQEYYDTAQGYFAQAADILD